ncbi:MAG TPA: tetratricopeptide repeat protein, partial [Cyclobacteriaceae bacterium]|nr:tetratricopeptide repeat protein [Cyclobacteriaceae bacterium]
MVNSLSFRVKKILLLAAVGISFHIMAGAQVATQNLFRRSQYIEYLRLRNLAASQQTQRFVSGQTMTPGGVPLKTELVEFNVKCKTNPTIHNAWLKGEVHFAFSRWKEAGEVFSELIRGDSSFCDAYFRLSQCYVAQNNLAAGYGILVLAKKRFPDNPLLNLGFGQLYLFLSFPRTALYYFEKQIILHPNDPEGFLGASWTAHELNDDVKAILYLKKGRDLLTNQIIDATGGLTPVTSLAPVARNPLGPTLDYLYLFESILYNNLNQNEKSREALRHLTNQDQQEISVFRNYCVGMYYYNKGEKYYHKAKRNISKAAGAELYVDPAILRQLGIRTDPTDFKTMVLRENYSKLPLKRRSAKSPLQIKADTLFQNRYLDAAAETYTQCLQEDSSNLIAFERLGECYREMRRQDDALAIYRLASLKFPEEIKFTLLLAREQVRAGQISQAVSSYQTAIAADKKNYQAYYGACLALAHQGEFAKALEVWNSGAGFISA